MEAVTARRGYDRTDTVTALNGAYCPIPSPDVLAKRLASGVYVFTEFGLEMRCSKCREYYPADTEFFFSQPNSAGGLHRCCKACYLIQTGRTRSVA